MFYISVFVNQNDGRDVLYIFTRSHKFSFRILRLRRNFAWRGVGDGRRMRSLRRSEPPHYTASNYALFCMCNLRMHQRLPLVSMTPILHHHPPAGFYSCSSTTRPACRGFCLMTRSRYHYCPFHTLRSQKEGTKKILPIARLGKESEVERPGDVSHAGLLKLIVNVSRYGRRVVDHRLPVVSFACITALTHV